MLQRDKDILRGLAAEIAEIAQLPVHREKAEMWRRLNDLEPVRPMVWITETTVSPEMHWEFAVKHELPWFERWGLNYYGCCEPLDTKIDVLRRIPRLRKISISPWADVSRAAEGVGMDYVISYKPNPAVVADAVWGPEMVRDQLRDAIRRAVPRPLEIILKDISTVRHEPRRLWDWARIVMEVVEEVSCETCA